MSHPKPKKDPTYRRQSTKSGDRGFCEIDGHRYYFGRFDDPKAKAAYHRFIGKWLAAGRQVLPADVRPADGASNPNGLTILEVLAAFWIHAETFYRRDGKPTTTVHNYRAALRFLNEWYGETSAASFGPLALEAVRQKMIDAGLSRNTCNQQTHLIRGVFRWAASKQLIPVTTCTALETVAPLLRGRCEARETDPVKPIPDETVNATVAHMMPTLAAMVRLQRLTGMRPAEVCAMRGCDLDTTQKTWVYRPSVHKTQHVGKSREVFIGPKGKAILMPFLQRDTQAFLFSPAESECERREVLHAERVTPLSCGNHPGSNKKARPERAPRDHYTSGTYARAIAYACERAFPVPEGTSEADAKAWRKNHRWTPNRLRHSFATDVRRKAGLETTSLLLGHSRVDTTEIYAESDKKRAAGVALRIG